MYKYNKIVLNNIDTFKCENILTLKVIHRFNKINK